MVLSDNLRKVQVSQYQGDVSQKGNENVRDFLPDSLNVAHFSLNPKLPSCPDLPSNFLDFIRKDRELVYRVVDRVDQTQHLSRNTDTDDLLREISSCNSRLC